MATAKKAKEEKKVVRYDVLQTLFFDATGKEIKAGKVTSDIPEEDIKWLTACGAIQVHEEKGEKPEVKDAHSK